MEAEALVPVEPCTDLGVLMGGIIIEDDVNEFPGWNLRLDGVEEADKLLMPVALQAAAERVWSLVPCPAVSRARGPREYIHRV